jgi:Microcystin-dependent protein
MDEAYVGTIFAFAFNWAPVDYMVCAGQVLQIQQYAALYSLIGTTYGGNGTTTFALPDLRGRVPMGWTNNALLPGITPNLMGQARGFESNVLGITQLPAHTHTATVSGQGALSGSITAVMNVNDNAGGVTSPSSQFLAADSNGSGIYAATAASGKTLNSGAITVNNGLSLNMSGLTVAVAPTPGPTAAVPVMQPSLVINYCIAVAGLYPPRP